MKSRILSLTAAAAIAALSSCNKSEDDTTSLYFDGTISFSMPKYVHYGEVYHLTPTGISKEDGNTWEMGFSLYNSLTGVTDTLRLETDPIEVKPDVDVTISKDTLGTFTLTYAAFATGYTRSTSSKTYTTVKSGLNTGSITNAVIPAGAKTFTDPRDGKSYLYLDIDNVSWMLRNLESEVSGCSYLGTEKAVDEFFGRYYSYQEALTACPEGWTLPSDVDWKNLCAKFNSGNVPAGHSDIPGASGSLMEDRYFNSSRMWEYWPDVKITNATGLATMPCGYGVNEDGNRRFFGFNDFAVFWTSDTDGSDAVCRYIYEDNPAFFAGFQDKNTFLASVRCIRKQM